MREADTIYIEADDTCMYERMMCDHCYNDMEAVNDENPDTLIAVSYLPYGCEEPFEIDLMQAAKLVGTNVLFEMIDNRYEQQVTLDEEGLLILTWELTTQVERPKARRLSRDQEEEQLAEYNAGITEWYDLI